MRAGLLVGTILAGTWLLADRAAAKDAPTAPPAPAPAAAPPRLLEVPLGFHVVEVRDIDVRSMTFVADLYYWVRIPAGAPAQVEKGIEFMNGRLDGEPKLDDEKTVDGWHYLCWRAKGTFSFRADLRRYPFDVQRLAIVVEHEGLEAHELRFVDDVESYRRGGVPEGRWGVQPGLDLPEFRFRGASRVLSESAYPTTFGDPTNHEGLSRYSRLTLTIEFRRDYLPYLVKILIPILVILAITYLVFWFPHDQFSTACQLALTTLLATIASNFSVAQSLPNVGYMVVSDWFFLGTYLLLSLTMLQLVITYVLERKGRREQAERWTRAWRWGFPLLALASGGSLLAHAVVAG